MESPPASAELAIFDVRSNSKIRPYYDERCTSSKVSEDSFRVDE